VVVYSGISAGARGAAPKRRVRPGRATRPTAGRGSPAGAEVEAEVGAGSAVADGVVVPEGVVVVEEPAAGAGGRASLHEEVAGRRWRVSAGSFFQSRSDGAAALVDVVGRVVAQAAPRPGHHVDAYGGVGLLAAAAVPGSRVTLVEANPVAVADAAHNLADLGAAVVAVPVERWAPEAADVVVADPARAGLGRRGAEVLAATGAPVVVLVSCDAASLGRDAGLLAALGFRLDHCELVDLFPHTPHVEVVTRFRR
jgi:23S rRNA (uracil1939-C5)-methyltransferase